MIIKEKVIFWPLLVVFIGILISGLSSQGKKREATEELLQDIEQATKTSIAKKKASFKDMWDIDTVKAVDTLDGYRILLKRSPFFRVSPEKKVKKIEVVDIKEKPKEPILKYKGKVVMGTKVMVVIEDQGTGKSFFVQEGDRVGDFLVYSIDEKEVVLKKKGGEDLRLRAVKKQEEK